MIILLDTATPTCHLTLVDGDRHVHAQREAGRGLAKGLLGYINEQLAGQGKTWKDIIGIGVFKGPGSFTGLRIGLTVANTIADAQGVPIVGAEGDEWQKTALRRLINGENDTIVLPLYGGEARITAPRK